MRQYRVICHMVASLDERLMKIMKSILDKLKRMKGIVSKQFVMEHAHDYASFRYMILLEDPESFIHKLTSCLHS